MIIRTGTPIPGATYPDSYTPSTAVLLPIITVLLIYHFGGCNTIYSNTAEIIIYLDPLVDLQPISISICMFVPNLPSQHH